MVQVKIQTSGFSSAFGKVFGAIFFSIFLLAGLGFGIMLGREVVRTLVVYEWSETKCDIVRSRVVDQGDSYEAEIIYEVEIDSSPVERQTISRGAQSVDSYSDASSTVSRFPQDSVRSCWVGPAPDFPTVLERRLPILELAFMLLPLVFVLIGGGGVYASLKSSKPKLQPDGLPPIEAISGGTTKGVPPWVKALIALICFGGGGAMTWFLTIKPAVGLVDSRSWEATDCKIISSRVQSHSSDDGTTYSVDILYEYRADGRTLRSNRFDFLGGSSSGYDGKARVVANHPPGSIATCWVDPENPDRVVLDRDLKLKYLLCLIPVFILGVAFVIYNAVRSKNRPSGNLGPGMREIESFQVAVIPATGPLVLEAQTTPTGRVFISLFFGLFWNGIVAIPVSQAIKAARSGDPDWVLSLFMIPFVLVGLGIIVFFFHSILALANPRLQMSLDRPLRLGDCAHLSWSFRGATRRLKSLEIYLIGEERATYRQGTDTRTATSVFYKALLHRSEPVMSAGEVEISPPEDSVPSFDLGNNEIAWRLEASGDIANWPDVDEKFTLDMLPVGERF